MLYISNVQRRSQHVLDIVFGGLESTVGNILYIPEFIYCKYQEVVQYCKSSFRSVLFCLFIDLIVQFRRDQQTYGTYFSLVRLFLMHSILLVRILTYY